MVRQVLVTERVLNESGTPSINPGSLAFGTHGAKFFENDDGEVLSAFVLGNQEVRIILDELVRGNFIEEIACADSTFSRVPVGTDPDDIADCSGPVDSLVNCDTVCLNPDTGEPVGVLDENEDGAPDDVRMIDYNPDPMVTELAVQLTCGGVDIPLDPEQSFWSPSGNQTFPSNGFLGHRGLGPAIVLRPIDDIGLRTSSDCTVSFRPELVDHDGNQVCAPANGDINANCTSGDTSLITFSTETLQVVSTAPRDEDDDVGVEDSLFMSIGFNANIDEASVGAITLTEAGTPVDLVTVEDDNTFLGGDFTSFSYTLGRNFLTETEYVLTIGSGLTDRLGGAIPAEQVITWTTEGFEFDDSEPEDGDVDVAITDGDPPVSTIVELEFNAPPDPASFGALSVTADAAAVPFTATPNVDDARIIEVSIDGGMQPSTTYVVSFTTALVDDAGHAVTEAGSITFTTAAP